MSDSYDSKNGASDKTGGCVPALNLQGLHRHHPTTTTGRVTY